MGSDRSHPVSDRGGGVPGGYLAGDGGCGDADTGGHRAGPFSRQPKQHFIYYDTFLDTFISAHEDLVLKPN